MKTLKIVIIVISHSIDSEVLSDASLNRKCFERVHSLSRFFYGFGVSKMKIMALKWNGHEREFIMIKHIHNHNWRQWEIQNRNKVVNKTGAGSSQEPTHDGDWESNNFRFKLRRFVFLLTRAISSLFVFMSCCLNLIIYKSEVQITPRLAIVELISAGYAKAKTWSPSGGSVRSLTASKPSQSNADPTMTN